MFAKYTAIFFVCIYYAAGDNYLNTTDAATEEQIDAWETEIEKTITVKLKNKIEETLEKKLEDRLEKVLEELVKTKLKSVYSCCNKANTEPLAWIKTTTKDASTMSDCAVIAGYEGHDKTPLWVIRARHEGQLIPGKLAISHKTAFVPLDGVENPVDDIEVLCANPKMVRWVRSHGYVPPKAIIAGYTESGLPLYVGRAKEGKSLTPGKVVPEQRTLFVSFGGKEIQHKNFEILCEV